MTFGAGGATVHALTRPELPTGHRCDVLAPQLAVAAHPRAESGERQPRAIGGQTGGGGSLLLAATVRLTTLRSDDACRAPAARLLSPRRTTTQTRRGKAPILLLFEVVPARYPGEGQEEACSGSILHPLAPEPAEESPFLQPGAVDLTGEKQ